MLNFTEQKYLIMSLMSCFILLFFYSCEPERIAPGVPETEEILPDGAPNGNDQTEKPGNDPLEEVGNGSGQIIIKNVRDKDYVVKPGIYWNIIIENAENTSITGLDSVKISGGDMIIRNINGLTISGISFEDWGQNSIHIFGDADNLVLKNLKFKNIRNTVISFGKNNKYDGTPQSFSENIHLINIHAENVGTLFGAPGGLGGDGSYGLIKGFKLTNSTIINSPELSNGIYLGLAENYEISNNTIDNVNANNNNHNGIFHVIGNGKIFGNKITNHQGNAVRAWLTGTVEPNGTVEIYNNKVYNSRRYSAFELQVPPSMENQMTFKPVNAKIYNNTVGKLNTGQPKYFEGRLLDLYNTHGTLEIYNNLSFDLRDSYLINNMSDTKIIKNSNNKYFQNASDAVVDLKDFKSKITTIGAN